TSRRGWRWSEHVGPAVGARRCSVEHVGLVVSGVATAAFADGRVVELRPGDLFYIPPEPHDSWVVGDEPYVSLHFLGAERYARSSTAEGRTVVFFSGDTCIYKERAVVSRADHPTVRHFHETHGDRPDPADPPKPLDAAWLRQLCLDCGADDCGLVEIGRPALDDQRADILRY